MQFDFFQDQSAPVADAPTSHELGQYFTPAWAARELYEAYFPELGRGDLVWEPSVGDGAMLGAIPQHVDSIGSEIDPEFAELVAKRVGRTATKPRVRISAS